MWSLATVPWGFPKAPRIPVWSLISSSARQHLVDADDMEGVELHSDAKTIFATAFHHVLGTNTGSLQGLEESCSYSSDTMWPQSGNSSTLAFLRPKSKMPILASGTPRQERVFGKACPYNTGNTGRGGTPWRQPGSSVVCRGKDN